MLETLTLGLRPASEVLRGPVTAVVGREQEYEFLLDGGDTTTHFEDLCIPVGRLSIVYLVCDADCTVTINDPDDPDLTINLLADKPLVWHSGMGMAQPFLKTRDSDHSDTASITAINVAADTSTGEDNYLRLRVVNEPEAGEALVTDDFTGSTAALEGRASGATVYVNGKPYTGTYEVTGDPPEWEDPTSSLQTNSGTARATTAFDDPVLYSIGAIDCGSADVVIDCDVTWSASDLCEAGPAFRYIDEDHYYALRVVFYDGFKLQLYEYDGEDVVTQRESIDVDVDGGHGGQTRHVTIWLEGSNMYARVTGDGQDVRLSAVVPKFAGAKKHGIFAYQGGSSYRTGLIDNFIVRSIR